MKRATMFAVPLMFASLIAFAQQADPSIPSSQPAIRDLPTTPTPSEAERIKQFTETLSNVKLIGRFTILGKEDASPKPEEYTIESVSKLPQGDFWMFKARIKYGDTDRVFPLPLEVKWAADTPVITLTNFTIPAIGTFSSRVIIYNGKYAGTWTHGDVGGHLFGTVEKVKLPSE